MIETGGLKCLKEMLRQPKAHDAATHPKQTDVQDHEHSIANTHFGNGPIRGLVCFNKDTV